MKIFLRFSVASILVIGIIATLAPNASANYWGSYSWPTSDTYPALCLTAGVNILTGGDPDTHSLSAADSCSTSYQVQGEIEEFNSSNVLIAGVGDELEYYIQVPAKHDTTDGDYWMWSVSIDNNSYGFSCSNQGYSYGACWSNH